MKPFRKKAWSWSKKHSSFGFIQICSSPFEKAALCIETILGHLLIKSSCFIWVAVGLHAGPDTQARVRGCPLFITF
jgi:hypothetical protein